MKPDHDRPTRPPLSADEILVRRSLPVEPPDEFVEPCVRSAWESPLRGLTIGVDPEPVADEIGGRLGRR